MVVIIWVVATQRFYMFTPKIGEMIQFDEHIFQMGWNHQLVILYPKSTNACLVVKGYEVMMFYRGF